LLEPEIAEYDLGDLDEDIIRVEHHWYRAIHSQFRYRGEPNIIDLGRIDD
jgi:hypothetical protein